MIDYGACFQKFEIAPRGVVHIGGFNGAEDGLYRQIGLADRLFVEAQSDTFATLSANLAGTGAHCERLAISDASGTCVFHVAENGQSSSLLAMKRHLEIYPSILEIRTETVQTMRLDDLLAKTPYSAMTFNFLNIDIQGAELLALSGAVKTLRTIDMINTEVNFDELYEGAPHIRQLDSFLSAFDFIRVDTTLLHKTWGDALYVKNRFTKTRAPRSRAEAAASGPSDEEPSPELSVTNIAPVPVAVVSPLLALSDSEFLTRILLRRGMHAHDLWVAMTDTRDITICICATAEFADKNIAFGEPRDVYQATELKAPNDPAVVERIYRSLLARAPSEEEAALWAPDAELAFGKICSQICWTLEFLRRVRSGVTPDQTLREKCNELIMFSKSTLLDCYNASIAQRIASGYPAAQRMRTILANDHLTIDAVMFGSLESDLNYVVAALRERLPGKTFEWRFRTEADIGEQGFSDREATIYLTNNNYLYGHLDKIAARLEETDSVMSACWLFDNHHQLHYSTRIARVFDIVFPAHANGTEYLYNTDAIVGPVVPCAVIQWSRGEAIDFYRQAGGRERSDALYGRFNAYDGRVTARNRFLEAVHAESYGSSVLIIEAAKNDWDWKGPLGRFEDYALSKVAVSTPILNDIPIRVFDSLLTGQIPILPHGSLGLEIALPLEVQRALPVYTYLPNDLDTLRRAYQKALVAFDAEGQAGADRRHQAAIDRHMLAHRVIGMIDYLVGASWI